MSVGELYFGESAGDSNVPQTFGLLALGHLGRHSTDRIVSICVTSPKGV